MTHQPVRLPFREDVGSKRSYTCDSAETYKILLWILLIPQFSGLLHACPGFETPGGLQGVWGMDEKSECLLIALLWENIFSMDASNAHIAFKIHYLAACDPY